MEFFEQNDDEVSDVEVEDVISDVEVEDEQ